MANRTRNRQKPPQRAAGRLKNAVPPGDTGGNGRRIPKLAPADIAELAEQMQIPDGMLQMLLDRYPELGKPLARRWALTARSTTA